MTAADREAAAIRLRWQAYKRAAVVSVQHAQLCALLRSVRRLDMVALRDVAPVSTERGALTTADCGALTTADCGALTDARVGGGLAQFIRD